MTYVWQTDPKLSDGTAVTFLPPAAIEETGWDILLALHSDRQCKLTLDKLALLLSVPETAMYRWLPALERRDLITRSRHPRTGEIFAVLTRRGRDMLDRYFLATAHLQVGTPH